MLIIIKGAHNGCMYVCVCAMITQLHMDYHIVGIYEIEDECLNKYEPEMERKKSLTLGIQMVKWVAEQEIICSIFTD